MGSLKEFPACMYGKPHAGDYCVVRGKTGQTVGALCLKHYKESWQAMDHPGFHVHTHEEMEARGDDEQAKKTAKSTYTDDAREDDIPTEWGDVPEIDPGDYPVRGGKAKDRASVSTPQPPTQHLDPVRRDDRGITDGYNPAQDSIVAEPVSGVSSRTNAGGGQDATAENRPAGDGRQLATRTPDYPPLQAQAPAVAPARGASGGSGGQREVGQGAFYAPIEWWQGAGELVLEDYQLQALWEPFDPNLFEVREHDGRWYLPWVHAWQRLLKVFAPSVPQLLPIGEPQIFGEYVSVHYAMLVNGQFLGEAVGTMAKKNGNRSVSYADCVEGCVSDAITRIGKRLGLNLELWQPETIRNLKKGQRKAQGGNRQ